ncbi:cytidylate kinase family protein [Limnochorda pilosa]|uniref:Cytidylate kinase-like family protein n=1 Tax=Limnochorda pilosa TaxID=1555112 RepID=A0A0K2SHI7_LIMPI|nr:cytidylate kinase family protein [Limnochorda pilosa]BAS26581.1 hypothetical protein LIP_0724 [Limnochorda pilosa]
MIRIVTVSREMGARGERIAARLAQRLNLQLWDGHRLAAELREGGHPPHLASLAIERSPGLVQGVTAPREAYREAARNVLLQRAGKGLLLLGTGGNQLLRDVPGSAHLRLVASWPERVAQAMEDLSQQDRGQVEEILRQSDRRRAAYVRYLYASDWADPSQYGLTLRTDGMDLKDLLDLCVAAVRLLTARERPPRAPAQEPAHDEVSTAGVQRRPHIFAHPSEEAFARFLDFYRIRWEYEPRTFPLEVDQEGNVREAFTPDFYLQDLDLYVELTTMKQSLVNRKNQKLRKLREKYPGIQVKLLYARDFRYLQSKYAG